MWQTSLEDCGACTDVSFDTHTRRRDGAIFFQPLVGGTCETTINAPAVAVGKQNVTPDRTDLLLILLKQKFVPHCSGIRVFQPPIIDNLTQIGRFTIPSQAGVLHTPFRSWRFGKRRQPPLKIESGPLPRPECAIHPSCIDSILTLQSNYWWWHHNSLL